MTFNLQEVVTLLGGEAIFLGAAAWLVKALVSHRLTHEDDKFRAQLKADADIEIERLKTSLQMIALEHQVRFSKLHERRAEVIGELYKLLLETTWTARKFIFTDMQSRADDLKAGIQAYELYRFIDLNRLYLPDSVCTLLDNFDGIIRRSISRVGIWWTIENPNEETRKRQNEVMRDACTALENDIPALRKELLAEFRTLLGVIEKPHT
jgi:hypothetical protein